MIPDREEMLSAYANDELSRVQHDFVEEHLTACPDCRGALAGYVQTRNQLRTLASLPREVDIMHATTSRIAAGGTGFRKPLTGLMRPAMAVIGVVAALAAVVAWVQLVGGPSGTDGFFAKAYAAMEQLQSYRMAGITTSSLNGETTETAFDWSFSTPRDYQGSLSTDGQITEFVIVDGLQYIRGTDAGGGVVIIVDDGFASGSNPSVNESLFSPVPSCQRTLALIDSLIDVEELQGEEIGGVSTRHYLGRVDIDPIFDEALATLDASMPGYEAALETFALQRQATLAVELWIGASDGRIHRLVIDGRAPTVGPVSEEPAIIGWMTFHTDASYSGFNDPVTFEEPVTASGDLEPGWALLGSSGASPPPDTVLERVAEDHASTR